MNILITAVQVPFTRGGAEVLVDGLVKALRRAGHLVDVVQLPFSATPKTKILDSLLLWRSLELESFSGREVDLVIGTKFPAYCVNHPKKVIWLIHQHRQAYDLYSGQFGDFSESADDEALRQLIVQADRRSFAEAEKVFTISAPVAERLQNYLGVSAKTLLPPPPLLGRYYRGESGNFILSVGRICALKRPDLLLQALAETKNPISARFVGAYDEPGYEEYIKSEVARLRLGSRVEFLGRLADEELLACYANCAAVYYAPHDEDYGFVTLEALASGKPVITATDSGGVLSFVEDGKNAVVAEPTAQAMARAIERLFSLLHVGNMELTNDAIHTVKSWDEIVATLTQQKI